MRPIPNPLRHLKLLAPLAFGACLSLPVGATPIAPAETPLFITVSIAPNLVITLDDSGSMGSAGVPDAIDDIYGGSSCNNTDLTHCRNRYKSSYYNALYYNPNITYTPPPRYNNDGTPCTNVAATNPDTCYPNASFTNAWRNGFDTTRGTVNLSNNYWATRVYRPQDTSQTNAGSPNGANDRDYYKVGSSWPAYYYLFDASNNNCNGTKDDDDCYDRYNIPNTATIRQNFANWYSYYRTRNLATVSGAMHAFAGLDGDVRVAWQGLSTCNSFGTDCDGWSTSGNTIGLNKDNRIRRLDAVLANGKTHKQELYEWLSRLPSPNAGSTYLLSAANRAGAYFTGSVTSSHPYAEDPQTALGTIHACRRSVHLLMTDGGWCSDSVSVGDTNSDTTVVNKGPGGVSNYSWTPAAPYRDGQSNNLADIAFKYWATDLQPGLADNMLPIYKDYSGNATAQWLNPKNDPATWQHMVTYTVGLGLTSTMNGTPISPGTGTLPVWGGSTYAGDYSKLLLGTGCSTMLDSTTNSPYCWPYTKAENCPTDPYNQQRKVYDLWHAAISSRGQFFSADSPDEVTNAFNAVLTAVAGDTSTSAALAANSTSLQLGSTLVYQAKFDPKDWSGKFLALPVQAGGVVGTEYWDASTLIPAAAARTILTYNGSSGKTFTNCNSSINGSQKTALGDAACGDVMDWLRGSAAEEVRNGGTLRNRTVTVLGDIINSDPLYVKNEDFGYSSLPPSAPGRSSYADFVTGKSTRTPMLYVGANDGMLHGFQADVGSSDSGKEKFAYIPAGVYGNLRALTDPAYTGAGAHRYLVDGSPTMGDAYLSGSWKTVLVGGLNRGGKTIYALDITDPTGMSAADVLWEYNTPDPVTGVHPDSDMGYTYSQPQIGRLNDGSWAAIFGNGYDSGNERAYLYIVDLEDGTLIKKIPAGTACATNCSNGLSTPYLHDSNGDKIIDAVYAGDLQGNMWKFDLSASNSSTWEVAYSGSPLFTARNASNEVQPITAQPRVTGHPSGGYMVFFGTGRYLNSADIADTTVQSFYGIRDYAGPVLRSELQVQALDQEGTVEGATVRSTTQNPVDYSSQKGWYIDFSQSPLGERVVTNPLIVFGRVLFVTMIPSSDPCLTGGDSWLMQLDALTGGRPSDSVFSLNGDEEFDDSDKLDGTRTVSGVKSTIGIMEVPVIIEKDSYVAYGISVGTTTGTSTSIIKGGGTGPSGTVERVYWMQIQ